MLGSRCPTSQQGQAGTVLRQGASVQRTGGVGETEGRGDAAGIEGIDAAEIEATREEIGTAGGADRADAGDSKLLRVSAASELFVVAV